jgi:stage II sporulation protein AA (anti-sigma F factor antagonist)
MSDDRTASQGGDSHDDDLHVKAEHDRTGTTIILEGEFDLTGTDRFWAVFRETLAASPRSITLHAHGLTFIDSAGLQALLQARAAATDAGVAFRVSEPSPALRRIAEMTGIEDLLEDE